MNNIAEKLRQAYHHDLTDVPLLLDAVDEIEKLEKQHDLALQVHNAMAETIKQLRVQVAVKDAALRELLPVKDHIERLHQQNQELKSQVERLLAKEAERITSVSQIYHRLLREQPNSNKDLMAEAERLQPDLPENPFNERKDHE